MSTRRTLAAIVLAASAPFALSACGTSFGAQTNQQYQAGVGSNLRSGPVGVYNGLFVDNGNGTLTFSGGLLAEQDQTIESVTVDGAAKKLPSAISLKADELLTLGTTGEIIVKSDDLEAGDYVTVSFAASPAGDISLEVPIVERTETYASVAKRPTPAADAETTQEEEADPGQGDQGQSDLEQSDTSPGA